MSNRAARQRARQTRQRNAMERASREESQDGVAGAATIGATKQPVIGQPATGSRAISVGGAASVSSAVATVMPTTSLKPGRQLGNSGPAGAYLGALGLTSIPRSAGRQTEILELIRTVRDFDADASAAVWIMLLIANSGHTVEALLPGDKPNPEGTTRLNDLAKRAWKLGGGGADTLAGTLFLAFFSYGGGGIEVEVTDDLLDIEDFHPFGPAAIEFRNITRTVTRIDADTGEVVTGEKSVVALFPARTIPGVVKQPLSEIQTHYLPLHPDLDDPYGRPPLLPALHALLSLMQIIKLLQDVAKVHGFGMRDIKVLELALRERAPSNLRGPGQEDALAAYINSVLLAVQEAINNLEATDTFVHTDTLEVNTSQPGGQGINLDKVIDVFSRRAKTALKSMPIMLGDVENGTQTHGTVQWQIYVKSIHTVQDLCKRLLEWAYNTALRVWGIPGRARVEFETVRETDAMIEANTETVVINNAERKYKLGSWSFEEMSEAISGHAPRGSAPPTYAEEFAHTQNMATANSALAAAQLGSTGGGSGGNNDNSAPAANQPGTDAGLTQEEGTALDQSAATASTNTARYANAQDAYFLGGPDAYLEYVARTIREEVRTLWRNVQADLVQGVGAQVQRGAQREISPDLLDHVYDDSLIADMERWVSSYLANVDPTASVEQLVELVIAEFGGRILTETDLELASEYIDEFVRQVVQDAYDQWHADVLMDPL